MSDHPYQRFAHLTFDDFRRMAKDASLSPHEKIGFPDAYREGKEAAILADVAAKLPALGERGRTVLDIGPGCGALAQELIALCARQEHRLLLVDSAEVLSELPDAPSITKYPAFYPSCEPLFEAHTGKVDAIVAYSVLQYVFVESNLFWFLDRSLELLAPGGRLLLGDLPNQSKRNRFFASETGVRFHQAFMQTTEAPEVAFNRPEPGQLDDSVIFAILQRARLAGFDAYVLPQGPDLPMANRREDVLIIRP